MPQFKTTAQIFHKPGTPSGDIFDPNWLDSDKIILPPKKDWDYARDLQIEDVSIWEVLTEQTGGKGVYASWDPYGEFYMVKNGQELDTFYGKGAQKRMHKRLKELNITLATHSIWVEPEDMWLYTAN